MSEGICLQQLLGTDKRNPSFTICPRILSELIVAPSWPKDRELECHHARKRKTTTREKGAWESLRGPFFEGGAESLRAQRTVPYHDHDVTGAERRHPPAWRADRVGASESIVG